MDSAPAETTHATTSPARTAPESGPLPLKILVAGGFGVGKTTLVSALSEVPPLSTEQAMTSLSGGIDDVADVPDKTTTTVAMDFGRVSVDQDLVLYLFGTPGQSRFWFMWDELARGALGAVVLADTAAWTAASPLWTSSSAAACRSWSASTVSGRALVCTMSRRRTT